VNAGAGRLGHLGYGKEKIGVGSFAAAVFERETGIELSRATMDGWVMRSLSAITVL
jgi:hypothetical protein